VYEDWSALYGHVLSETSSRQPAANPFNVSASLTDAARYGSAARIPVPMLGIDGEAVRTQFVNDYSDTYRLVVAIEPGRKKCLDPTGRFVTRKGAKIARLTRGKFTLNPMTPIEAMISHRQSRDRRAIAPTRGSRWGVTGIIRRERQSPGPADR